MERFYDDEDGYLRWVTANSAGYVLNCYKATGRTGGPYMLHKADCYTLDSKNLTTGQYYKVCSNKREELLDWAEQERADKGFDKLRRCSRCKP
jgi:hypothetical protein